MKSAAAVAAATETIREHLAQLYCFQIVNKDRQKNKKMEKETFKLPVKSNKREED